MGGANEDGVPRVFELHLNADLRVADDQLRLWVLRLERQKRLLADRSAHATDGIDTLSNHEHRSPGVHMLVSFQ